MRLAKSPEARASRMKQIKMADLVETGYMSEVFKMKEIDSVEDIMMVMDRSHIPSPRAKSAKHLGQVRLLKTVLQSESSVQRSGIRNKIETGAGVAMVD